MYPAVFAAGSFLYMLICRGAVTVNFIITNRVTVLAAAIAVFGLGETNPQVSGVRDQIESEKIKPLPMLF